MAATTLRLYGWYMCRQRYLHTVVTNLHGPDAPRTYCGAPIVEIVPRLIVVGVDGSSQGDAALAFALEEAADPVTPSMS